MASGNRLNTKFYIWSYVIIASRKEEPLAEAAEKLAKFGTVHTKLVTLEKQKRFNN